MTASDSPQAGHRKPDAGLPAGIATVVPGERLGGQAQPMLDYLAVFEQAANRFPGFESEIQGVYRRTESDGSIRLYTFVLKD